MSRIVLGLFVIVSFVWAPVLDAAPPSPGYVVQGIGPLPGDNEAIGFGVNDSGSVVGRSFGPDGERAFYWDRPTGVLYQLTTTGATGAAFAIAGGPAGIAYAVGHESSPGGGAHAVIWIAPPTSSPIALDGAGSRAFGVNDNGVAVGTASGVPIIWAPDGNNSYVRTNISLLPGQEAAIAEDINSDGIVVGGGFELEVPPQRAFLRLLNGSVIELAPAPGDNESRAAAVSDNVTIGDRNLVYVGGRTGDAFVSRGVRWTVDVDTGDVLDQTVLDLQFAAGVNGAGDVTGASSDGVGRRARQSATLWRNGIYIKLEPPRGGRNTASLGMAGGATSPLYVVGDTFTNKMGIRVQAVVWEVN